MTQISLSSENAYKYARVLLSLSDDVAKNFYKDTRYKTGCKFCNAHLRNDFQEDANHFALRHPQALTMLALMALNPDLAVDEE